MAFLASVSATPLSFSIASPRPTSTARTTHKRSSPTTTPLAALSSSPSSGSSSPPPKSFVESPKIPENGFNHALASPKGNNPLVRLVQSTESSIERAIFDFRFLALFAIVGSLAGSLLCFLNGCVYIVEAYKVYWTSCVKGIHTGKMVLLLVEAIDVYLAGTVMLIFGMGLYGLFITNVSPDVPPTVDRALTGSSLFGMFALKIWRSVLSRFEVHTRPGNWDDELIWAMGYCKGNSFRALLFKLSLSAGVYYIWLKRNSRVFGGRPMNSDVIFARIEDNLRLRVGSWKHIPNSTENQRFCHLWNWNISPRILGITTC